MAVGQKSVKGAFEIRSANIALVIKRAAERKGGK